MLGDGEGDHTNCLYWARKVLNLFHITIPSLTLSFLRGINLEATTKELGPSTVPWGTYTVKGASIIE